MQLIGRAAYPSEDEQAALYAGVAEAAFRIPSSFARSMSGATRLPPTANTKKTHSSAGGHPCDVDRTDIFLDQLRAILRASTRHNVRVMFPDGLHVTEVQRAKALLKQAMEELKRRGIKYDTASGSA